MLNPEELSSDGIDSENLPLSAPSSAAFFLPTIFPASIRDDDYHSKSLHCASLIGRYQVERAELQAYLKNGPGSSDDHISSPEASVRLARTIAELSASSPSVGEDDEEERAAGGGKERLGTPKSGVTLAIFSTTRYDIEKTVGRLIFGDRFQPNAALLLALSALGVLGWIGGTLGAFYIIPNLRLFYLGAPFIAYSILLINVDLAGMILRQRDTLIYHFWCVVFGVAFVFEVQSLENPVAASIGVALRAALFALLPFLDTGPMKVRVVFSKLVAPVLVILLIVVQVSFYFNWCGCQSTTIAFFGEISTTTRSLASSAVTNMTIVAAANVVAAYRHPSSVVMIHSRVETLLLTEREATLLRAMDRNATDLSRSSADNVRTELAELVVEVRSTMVEMFAKKRGSATSLPRTSSSDEAKPIGTNPAPPRTSEIEGTSNPLLQPPSYPAYPASICDDDYNSKILYCTAVIRSLQVELADLEAKGLGGSEQSIPALKKQGSARLAGTMNKLRSMNEGEDSNALQGGVKHGVVRAVASSLRFDVDNTVGRLIFGDCFQPNIMLFSILAVLFVIGVMHSMLEFFRLSQNLRLGVISAPFLVYFILVINVDLAGIILRQRDTRIYHFWCAVFGGAFIFEVQNLENPVASTFGVLFDTLGFALFPFLEATPLKVKVVFNKILGPIAVFLMIIMQVSFYFNWGGCQSTTIAFFGEINTTTRSLASSALSNMIILAAANVVVAYRHPSSLVMIQSRVETLLLTEREASLLRAIDRNARQLSKKSNSDFKKELSELLAEVRSRMVAFLTLGKNGKKNNSPGALNT